MNASHFRDYFIPLSGCFSPFPHGTIRYRSLHLFSLGWWSTRIQAGFHVSDRTQEHSTALLYFGDGALTLYGRPFQGRLPIQKTSDIEVLQPPPLAMLGENSRNKYQDTKKDRRSMIHVSCFLFLIFSVLNAVRDGFGLFPVRSPLLRESHMISFPLLREMFQFTE